MPDRSRLKALRSWVAVASIVATPSSTPVVGEPGEVERVVLDVVAPVAEPGEVGVTRPPRHPGSPCTGVSPVVELGAVVLVVVVALDASGSSSDHGLATRRATTAMAARTPRAMRAYRRRSPTGGVASPGGDGASVTRGSGSAEGAQRHIPQAPAASMRAPVTSAWSSGGRSSKTSRGEELAEAIGAHSVDNPFGQALRLLGREPSRPSAQASPSMPRATGVLPTPCEALVEEGRGTPGACRRSGRGSPPDWVKGSPTKSRPAARSCSSQTPVAKHAFPSGSRSSYAHRPIYRRASFSTRSVQSSPTRRLISEIGLDSLVTAPSPSSSPGAALAVRPGVVGLDVSPPRYGSDPKLGLHHEGIAHARRVVGRARQNPFVSSTSIAAKASTVLLLVPRLSSRNAWPKGLSTRWAPIASASSSPREDFEDLPPELQAEVTGALIDAAGACAMCR